MTRIRVLVVDDAVVVRRLLTDVLAADPALEVVGTAASGTIALQKLRQLTPDVVTLDVEMPGLSGIETVREIRKEYPALPVIMFSKVSESANAATIDALAAGASDYVTRPVNVGSMEMAMQAVRDGIIPKIKSLCGRNRVPEKRALPGRPLALRRPQPSPIEILAIGSSTGGPNALGTILPNLPADLPVPVVIVQHMPPVFTRLLAERLAARCAFPVVEATHGTLLERGHAWIAPGDHHLHVRRRGRDVRLELDQAPPENSCRPAVDPLFRSVAEVFGAGVLGVVLTGMGHDGCRGAEAIRERGGRVIVQDEATSVVWGMPGAVAEAGLADAVLPVEQIAADLVRRLLARPLAPAPGQTKHVQS